MRNEYYRLACPCVLRLKDGDALWIHTTQGGAAAVSFFSICEHDQGEAA